MDPLSQVFCLRWNNHRNNLLTVFDHLLQTEAFCDVTLACDGTSVKCHKILLSACSSYFQQLFMENTCEHPIVFLKDIKYEEIRAILDYMYKGEVNVAQEQLPGLLKVAELLRVKGLVEEEGMKLLTSGSKDSRPVVSTSDDHEASPSSRASSVAAAHGLNGKASASAADKDSSPPSTSAGPIAGLGRPPFSMYTSPAPQFPMFPNFPTLFPGAHNLFKANERASDREAAADTSLDKGDGGSPSPKEVTGSAKRKKTASGSGGSCSSKESGLGSLNKDPDHASAAELARRHEDKLHHSLLDRDDDLDKDGNLLQGLSPGGLDKSGIANYVPSQRLEWKRYKQYTRSDIMSAIEEVKKGMSALQASRKYGVPSRTLYDKVKKMGITTGRQMQRKALPNYPTSFPALGGIMGLDSYKDMADRMKDNDDNTSEGSQHGDGSDGGRATLVPPAGFSTLQMLNIMERMKESSKGHHTPEVSLTPMNLSTMLGHGLGHVGGGGNGNGGRRRMSESSPSPNGPGGSGGAGDDLDDDEDEMEDADEDLDDEDLDDRARPRERHTSAEIRAQFMADLRMRRVVPSSTGEAGRGEAASSTTASPPSTPTSSSARLAPPPQPSSTSLDRSPASDDQSLPPRKRKVSQEQQLRSPYNGMSGHDAAAASPVKEETNGNGGAAGRDGRN